MEQNQTKTRCPECGAEININELTARQIETRLKEEISGRYRKKFSALAVREKDLAEEKQHLAEKVEAEVKIREGDLQKRIEMEYKQKSETLIEGLRKDLKEKDASLLESQKKELELEKLKREAAITEDRHSIALEKARMESRKEGEKEAAKRETQRFELKLKEKEQESEGLKKKILELQQKSEAGGAAKGEALEILLEEKLQELFCEDRVEEIPRGRKGADIKLTVKTPSGKKAGTLLIESKNTKTFQKGWTTKLKEDQRREKADAVLLISRTLPEGIDTFGWIDGVLICGYPYFTSVLTLMREQLIALAAVQQSRENVGEKTRLLYDYLTGNEFKMQLEGIIEGFIDMKKDLDKERRSMEKHWNQREKQIEKITRNTAGLYGSIKGIAGQGIPKIPLLDFDGRVN